MKLKKSLDPKTRQRLNKKERRKTKAAIRSILKLCDNLLDFYTDKDFLT